MNQVLTKHTKVMALCLKCGAIFTRNGKNRCRNLVNVTNVYVLATLNRFGRVVILTD